MRISRKAEYALRALSAMARKPPAATSHIEELSRLGGIPPKFLEQIFLTLRKAGLLTSRRGVGGGYQLHVPAALMTLADIVTAIDGPIRPMGCTPPIPGGQLKTACECGTPGGCGAGRVFTDLQSQIHTFLSRITLADIVAREGGVMQFDI